MLTLCPSIAKLRKCSVEKSTDSSDLSNLSDIYSYLLTYTASETAFPRRQHEFLQPAVTSVIFYPQVVMRDWEELLETSYRRP